MSPALRRAGWLAVLVAVVVLIAVGARTTPTSGVSEDRLYSLAGQMKCLQCLGESVAGSQADIAIKMRSEIRAQMRTGRSDDEILEFFSDRYGQRVLLNPSGSGLTSLVWVIPAIVAGGGIAWLGLAYASARRGRRDATAREVSAEDRSLVEDALRHEDAVEDAVEEAPADHG
ncbi:MAG: cytochrome c-type biogenesis protein [Acidimicrobiales bacterium]